MSSPVRSFALTVAVLGSLVVAPRQAAAQNVSGTVTNRQDKAIGTFTGSFDLQSFTTNAAGEIVGVGRLTGTLTSRGGDVMSTVDRVVQIPVAALGVTHIASAEALAPAGCQVLFLQLGPIDLNVLGLVVHVDQITIDINAEPAGGILGELLCDLAGPGGLLDLNGLLGTILQSVTLGDLLNFLNGLLG